MRIMEREPYHIAAIKDLIAHYSAEHFRFAIKQCRDVVAKVIADDERSDQQRARVHILRYLDLGAASIKNSRRNKCSQTHIHGPTSVSSCQRGDFHVEPEPYCHRKAGGIDT